jgi:hypothetical protein
VVVNVERVWGTGRIVQLRGSRLYGTVRSAPDKSQTEHVRSACLRRDTGVRDAGGAVVGRQQTLLAGFEADLERG